MDIAMWGKALRVIPRIDKEQWLRLDLISRWLVASRSAVLVITFISAAVAGLLAAREGRFDLGLWLVLTFGLLMAHATNNLVNDLTDSWRGVDSGDDAFRAQYGPQTIEHGLLTSRQVLGYAAATGVLALAAGLYLVFARGGLTPWLLAAGAFFVLLYTWPLKHIGLGELAVLAVWGPLMIGGGTYVLTGEWSWNAALAGLPYALGATTVIFGKHIDKLNGDRGKGIRTLPVLMGERPARVTAIVLMALQYGLVIALVVAGYFTPVMLVVLLALRAFVVAYKVFREPRPAAPPPAYPEEGWPLWFVAFAFLHNRAFGMWFILGLLADVILNRLLSL